MVFCSSQDLTASLICILLKLSLFLETFSGIINHFLVVIGNSDLIRALEIPYWLGLLPPCVK